MMVVPASSAEGEWSFSTLRCLKTWLRTTQLNSLAICHVHQNKLDGQETNLWEPCWVKQGMHSGFWVIHLDDTFTAALSITAAPLHIFIPFLNLEFRAPNTLLCTCINNLGTKHQICNVINWKRKFWIAISHASIDLQSWKFAHICLSSQGTTCCHFSCPPVITVAAILRTYDNRCQSTSCIFDSLFSVDSVQVNDFIHKSFQCKCTDVAYTFNFLYKSMIAFTFNDFYFERNQQNTKFTWKSSAHFFLKWIISSTASVVVITKFT